MATQYNDSYERGVGTVWSLGAGTGDVGDGSSVYSDPVKRKAYGTGYVAATAGNGAYTTLFLKSDGTLWLSGRNDNGQLGDNTTVPKSSPVQVFGGGTNWKKLAGGLNRSTSGAIKTDGTLWMWGLNTSGQIGDNTLVNKSSPVQVFGGGTNWKQACNGAYHTGAIKTDGTLWMWGENGSGALGDNTTTRRTSPVQVFGGGTWKFISANTHYNTCGIKTDGTLWTWGSGYWSTHGRATSADVSVPVQTVDGTNNWKMAGCGYRDTNFGLKNDGTLWGLTASMPQTGGVYNNIKAYNVYSDMMKNDGTLWFRGGQEPTKRTTWGMPADWDEEPYVTGLCLDTSLYDNSADWDDIYLRKELFMESRLWGFGNNSYGQLGTGGGGSTNKSPVQTIAGGTNWKQVSSGAGFNTGRNSAGIKSDGTLWVWGENGSGQIGDNTIVSKLSPVQTIAGGTNWKQVSVGGYSVGAVKTDGTLWMWGDSYSGKLGTGDTNPRSSPVQTIAGGTNWKQVSVGQWITSAIKTDGTLWSWGYNGTDVVSPEFGNYSSPVQVITGGTNWKQVSVGLMAIGAIKTDGTLWMWGNGSDGELGNNATNYASSPIQTIAGGTDWKHVSLSVSHIGAIKTDGTLWMWGKNWQGVLGMGDNNNLSSPTQTICGGRTWKHVSCGYNNTSAIKTDGTLWSWGMGAWGGNGDDTTIYRSSPVQVLGNGTNWKQSSSGPNHTMAIAEYEL